MSGRESRTEMPAAMLDSLLVQMADETPEMPADFHEKWTAAVRAEAESAGMRAETSDKTGMDRTVNREAMATDAQGGNQKKTGTLRRLHPAWRGLISAAAVMVFLVGGTLLTRDAYREETLRQETAAMKAETAAGPAGMRDGLLSTQTPTGTPEATMPADSVTAVIGSDAEELRAAAPIMAAGEPMEEEAGDAAAFDAEEPMMIGFGGDGPDDPAMAAPGSDAAVFDAEEPVTAATDAAEDAVWDADAYSAEESAENADMLTVTENETAAKAVNAKGTTEADAALTAVKNETAADEADAGTARPATDEADPQTAPAEAPDESDKGGGSPVMDFLRDMGRFALQAAPWALAAGAGILAGWMLEKKRRKR